MKTIILAGAAALVMFSASPGFARDYPVCSRLSSNYGVLRCEFSNFRQCRATVMGQQGDCVRNPRRGYASGRRHWN